MNPEPSLLDRPPPAELRDVCGVLVRHLKQLGYPHADSSTCLRMLRAYFPYEPRLTEGSPDLAAGAAFLERFMAECRQRTTETTAAPRPRRCYGTSVEHAVAGGNDVATRAPRITELMSQLDADGHETANLRRELASLVDELAMRQFYR